MIKQRLYILLSLLAIALCGAYIICTGISNVITFYKTPSELTQDYLGKVKVFGTVSSVTTDVFTIKDKCSCIPVQFNKELPFMFKVGQGVIVHGLWDGKKIIANNVLVKHGCAYMK